jgi:hypothetical protein
MLLYLIVRCNILTYLHIIQMDMVKDEVIQKDRLSVIQESLLGFITEEVVQPRLGGFCLGTLVPVGLETYGGGTCRWQLLLAVRHCHDYYY